MKNTLKLKLLLLSLSSNNIFSMNGLREIKQRSRGGNFIQITDKKIIVPNFDLAYFVASVASDSMLKNFVSSSSLSISFDGYDSDKMHENIVSSFLSNNEQYNSETDKNYLYNLLNNANIDQDTFNKNEFVKGLKGSDIGFLKGYRVAEQPVGSSNLANPTAGNPNDNNIIQSSALASLDNAESDATSDATRGDATRGDASDATRNEKDLIETSAESFLTSLGIPSNSYKEKDWKLIGGIAILIIILAAVFLYFLKNNRSKSSVVLNKFSKR